MTINDYASVNSALVDAFDEIARAVDLSENIPGFDKSSPGIHLKAAAHALIASLSRLETSCKRKYGNDEWHSVARVLDADGASSKSVIRYLTEGQRA